MYKGRFVILFGKWFKIVENAWKICCKLWLKMVGPFAETVEKWFKRYFTVWGNSWKLLKKV